MHDYMQPVALPVVGILVALPVVGMKCGIGRTKAKACPGVYEDKHLAKDQTPYGELVMSFALSDVDIVRDLLHVVGAGLQVEPLLDVCWTEGPTDERTDARTNAWTDGRADGRADGRTHRRTGGRADGWTGGRTSGRAEQQYSSRTSS